MHSILEEFFAAPLSLSDNDTLPSHFSMYRRDLSLNSGTYRFSTGLRIIQRRKLTCENRSVPELHWFFYTLKGHQNHTKKKKKKRKEKKKKTTLTFLKHRFEIFSFAVRRYWNHFEHFQITLKIFQRYLYLLFPGFSALLYISSVIICSVIT